MAATAEPEKAMVSEKRTNKRKRPVPFLVILLILGGAGAVVFMLNPFGLRDNVVYPMLSNIPVVKDYLPVGWTAEPELTTEQLRARVKELENQLAARDEGIIRLEEKNSQNAIEIDRLREFEGQQLRYKQDKASFDERVAMEDPQAFADYYQKIAPENAEILYPLAAAQSENDNEVKRYISTFSEMDEEEAAAVLQQLIATDMNLVVAILRGMNNRAASAVLGSMDAAAAASVSKMMAPDSMIGRG